jgi:hypothetical protein
MRELLKQVIELKQSYQTIVRKSTPTVEKNGEPAVLATVRQGSASNQTFT